MRAAGAAAILLAAGYTCLLRRREGMRPIRVGRALLGDLSVLSYQICVLRRPLPELLEDALTEGPGAALFWTPLLAALQTAAGGPGLPACWRQAAEALPAPLDRMLAPLGELIPAGGERLSDAIEETREEIAGYLREETARQTGQSRVTAALCFSGACLLILVLL